MKLGDYIKEKREERGYSQRKLGLLSEVSNTTISRIENNETEKPDLPTLKSLEKALKLSENELVNIAYPPENKDKFVNTNVNYIAEAKSDYLADPKNKKKKFLYDYLKKLQELKIITEDGTTIIDEKEAEFALKDLESKIEMIRKMKETE